MPTYFKPLRRKIGVFTLTMACVFAAGWVRSLIWFEHWTLPQSELFSARGGIIHLASRGLAVRPNTKMAYDCLPLAEIDTNYWDRGKWLYFGFGYRDIPSGVHWRTNEIFGFETTIRIPYWSIVIPLTLLSAWLLLSKPRLTRTIPPAAGYS